MGWSHCAWRAETLLGSWTRDPMSPSPVIFRDSGTEQRCSEPSALLLHGHPVTVQTRSPGKAELPVLVRSIPKVPCRVPGPCLGGAQALRTSLCLS